MTRNRPSFNQVIAILTTVGLGAYSGWGWQAAVQVLLHSETVSQRSTPQQVSQSFPDRGSPPKTSGGGSRGYKHYSDGYPDRSSQQIKLATSAA